jgi:hypothetical protein
VNELQIKSVHFFTSSLTLDELSIKVDNEIHSRFSCLLDQTCFLKKIFLGKSLSSLEEKKKNFNTRVANPNWSVGRI